MGQGGLPGSFEGALIPDSTGPHFVTDDLLIYARASRPELVVRDVRADQTGAVSPRGANDLAAGGGRWAAWLAGFGLFDSTGLHLPAAGLVAVGPNGELAYTPDRQSGLGVTVREMSGMEWRLSDGVVYDLQLLGSGRAIWTFNQQVLVRNLPQPKLASARVWRPRVVEYQGELWLTYFTDEFGVILHPFSDASAGYVIAAPGVLAFQHDAVALGPVIRVVSAARAGELPGDLQRVDIDPSTTPRQAFTQRTPDPDPEPDPEPIPEPEPVSRAFTQQEIAILDAIGAKFEHLRRGTDDQRRDFTMFAAQQLAFSVNPAWGTKRADPGRPPSKDSVAMVIDGQLMAADIINGTTREMQYPNLEPLPGQVFIPVTPHDYLGVAPDPNPDPDPDPEPVPDPGRVASLEKAVAELSRDLVTLKNSHDALVLRLDAIIAGQVNTALSTLRIEPDLVRDSMGKLVPNPNTLVSTSRAIGHVHTIVGLKIVR